MPQTIRVAAKSLMAIAVAACCAPLMAADGTQLPSINVENGIVRVADIAIGGIHGNLVVARLPKGRNAVQFDEETRRSLLRSRLPGSALALRHDGPLQVRKLMPKDKPPARKTCFFTNAEIPAGMFLSTADVEQAPCEGSLAGRWVAYERLGPAAHAAPYSRIEIPAGSNLGSIRLPKVAPVAAGHRAVFRTSEGPVLVEREVITLQSARPGHSLFASTEDGEVIVSQLADNEDNITS